MKKNTIVAHTVTAWLSILIAVVLAAASTQLPLTFQNSTQIAGHAFLVAGLLQATLQIGAAVLFLIGLKRFKDALKRSYILIAISIVILGLARLQIPFFQTLNLWYNPWITYGLVQGVPTLAQFIMLMGIISFANLLKIKTKLTSPLMNLSILAFSMVAITITPHSPEALIGGTELGFDLFSNFCVIEAFLGILSAILVLEIKRSTTHSYANALAWLFLAIIFNTISDTQILLFHFIGFDNFYAAYGLMLLPNIISGALFLKAGHSFNNIKLY